MITYFFTKILVLCVRLISFNALYQLSDRLTWLMYHVVKYRKKVIQYNLENAFPEKSAQEIAYITKETYRNLCDILLESLKGMSIAAHELQQRYRFTNADIFTPYAGKPLIVLAGHLNNWEWGVMSLPLILPYHQAVGIYKPLSNIYIDEYISKKRGRFGMELVAMKKTREALLLQREKPAMYFFISDQTPSNLKNVVWMNFLQQDTACFLGADAIAREYQYPAFEITPIRIARGYYEVTFSPISIDNSHVQEGQIIEKFMRQLEKKIVVKPQSWLWSHKRWKHKKLL